MIDTKAIRNKILDLALRGKLTDQLPEDGTAEELYQQIQQEKQALIKSGKIKKEKPMPEIEETEILFEIPDNWKWVRLKTISTKIVDGDHNPPAGVKETTPYLMLSAQNIINGKLGNFDKVRYLSADVFEEENMRTRLEVNDVLLTIVGTMGRSCVYEGGLNICFQRSVAVITPLIVPRYLKYTFDISYIQSHFEANATGAAQLGFYLNKLEKLCIPLPPLAEQKRIVEKIEQAFSVLDTIDELQAKYADNLTALKSKLIDLAIRGKLTDQLPEDGTAEELYQQIQEEKQALIQSGKIKKEKPLPEIAETEIPFEIPENWKWVHLAEICSIINGDRGKNYPAKSTLKHEGIPFISALNLDGVSVKQDEHLLCLDDRQYELLGNGKLQKGDVVICIRGSLGKHGRYPFDKGAIASSLVISRLFYSQEIMGDYEMIWLDSSAFPAEIKRFDSGTAQPNLAANNLEKFLFPLPPLAEQKRIVDRLDKLLAVCDKLK